MFAESAEQKASRIGGGLLFVLAAYVVASAGWKLWTHQGAEFSLPGLILCVLAVPIMYFVLAGTRSDSWRLVELSGLVSDVIKLRSFSPSLSALHPGRSALGFSQSTNVPDVAAPHYIP